MKKETAIKLCSYWHGGQWSALYQYASSGIYTRENAILYLCEIQREIERPEYALRPFFRSKKNQNELNALKAYFEVEAKNQSNP